jgi:hypothetical protein
MAQEIPEKYVDLLQKPAFGNLGTLMKDGSPQVTPVWVDYDGKFVRINSAKGRVKDKNIPTATWKSAARSWKSPKPAPTTTSTSSRKNTSANPSIRFASLAKSA